MTDKELQAKIGWEPHKGQIPIIDSTARDITISAGRRWGKSAVCAYIVLREFLKLYAERDSVKIWVVAPSYELTQKVFSYLIRWISKVEPRIAGFIQNRPFPQIKINESTWIQCKSTENPNSLLGEELDLIILDEAAQVSRSAYERYIQPTTAARQGKTFFISTPFGQNWFYHKYIECQNKKDGAAFNFETRDNPYFPIEEWERSRNMLPEQVFAQEYKASFLPDAAAVFRGVDKIINDNILADYVPGHTYVMGVDLAKHEDFSVLTVIDRYNNNVVYWDRFRQIDYPMQKARISATAKRYNARIIIDTTGIGQPIKDDLAREGLMVDDYVFSNKSKKELVEKLSIFIEQENVRIPHKPTLIDELRSFGYKLTDSGNVVYSAPQGQHDDCVISLALAVWGLTGRPNPLTPIQQELKKIKRRPKTEDNFI